MSTGSRRSSARAARPGASRRWAAALSPQPLAASRPWAPASPRPSARASSRPSARASSRPWAPASPRPSARASSRPSARASSRPSAAGFFFDLVEQLLRNVDRLHHLRCADGFLHVVGADRHVIGQIGRHLAAPRTAERDIGGLRRRRRTRGHAGRTRCTELELGRTGQRALDLRRRRAGIAELEVVGRRQLAGRGLRGDHAGLEDPRRATGAGAGFAAAGFSTCVGAAAATAAAPRLEVAEIAERRDDVLHFLRRRRRARALPCAHCTMPATSRSPSIAQASEYSTS